MYRDISYGEFKEIVHNRIRLEFKLPWYKKIYHFLNKDALVDIDYEKKYRLVQSYFDYYGLSKRYSFSKLVFKNYYERTNIGDYRNWFDFGLVLKEMSLPIDDQFLNNYSLIAMMNDDTRFKLLHVGKHSTFYIPYPAIIVKYVIDKGLTKNLPCSENEGGEITQHISVHNIQISSITAI